VRQQAILSQTGLPGVVARLTDALKPWIVIILTGNITYQSIMFFIIY
jgi:hypothetical protein